MSGVKKSYRDITENIMPEDLILDLVKKLPLKNRLFIAIGGPGGTGKSSFAKILNRKIHDSVVLKLDNYKTPRKEREAAKIFGAAPKANRIDLIIDHLKKLKNGQEIEMPIYEGKIGMAFETKIIKPSRVIIVDGEISTYKYFISYMNISIFIDSHWRTQLNTRLNRDIDVRGFSVKKAIETFLHSNLTEFKEFGEHTKEWCDVHLFCNEDYSLQCYAISIELV
jgi:uridine kinase